MLKRLLVVVVSGIGLFVFFGNTNPDLIPIGFLGVPIILLFVFFSTLVYTVLTFSTQNSSIKAKGTSFLVGIILAISFLFYSTGGVSAVDIAIIAMLLAIGSIYINKY